MSRVWWHATLALFLFGCIPVIVKSIHANAFTIGIFRLGVATVGIAGLMAVRKEVPRASGRDLVRLAFSGLLFFGHWLTYFYAIKLSSASIGAIGLSTYGIHLLILGALFGGEKLNAVEVLAVLVAIAGAFLVVPSFSFSNSTTAGMLLATVSAVMYASLPVLNQRWTHLSTTTRALGQFGFGLLFFLLFASKSDWHLAAPDWAGLLFLGIGSTLIAHTLWLRVTTQLRPGVTSIIYYANVPFAIALGVILLGEPLTARMLAGGSLIIAGSVAGLMLRPRAAAR